MRGKVFSQHRKYNSNRITPAYAGKSAVVELLLITRQDHPRLCGEKPFSQDIFPPVPGSPPPMRGKVCSAFAISASDRITPAYAGKSVRTCAVPSVVQDHPRLCGEKYIPCDQSANRHRITPAYAGKSYRQSGRQRDTRDHPRLCGEKRIHLSHFRVMYGITPAYAGKSLFPQDILHRT